MHPHVPYAIIPDKLASKAAELKEHESVKMHKVGEKAGALGGRASGIKGHIPLFHSEPRYEGYKPASDTPCVVKGQVFVLSGVRKGVASLISDAVREPQLMYMHLLRDKIEYRKTNGKLVKTVALETVKHLKVLVVYPFPHALKLELEIPDVPGTEEKTGPGKIVHKFHPSRHHHRSSLVFAALNDKQKRIWVTYIGLCRQRLRKDQIKMWDHLNEEVEQIKEDHDKALEAPAAIVKPRRRALSHGRESPVQTRMAGVPSVDMSGWGDTSGSAWVKDDDSDSDDWVSEEGDDDDTMTIIENSAPSGGGSLIRKEKGRKKGRKTKENHRRIIHLPHKSRPKADDPEADQYTFRQRRRSWDSPWAKAEYYE